MDIITYPCWDLSWIMFVKGGPDDIRHCFLFVNEFKYIDSDM